MVEDVKPHQLYKQLDAGSVIIVYDQGSIVSTTAYGQGWENIPQVEPNQSCIVNRTYIDLAGWSRQDLTSFVQGVDVQKCRTPFNNTPGTVDIIWEIDLITTRKISDEELSDIQNKPPGFLPLALDLMEVIYGESRTYIQNLQVPISFMTSDSATFGSGNPTAMDKLHWTRIYLLQPSASAIILFSPTNLVVQAVTAKEKDLVWMERLRRSYVLQDQADI